jgi:CRP/FNR family cyclic AMP-dependent transcriptional regulator
MNEDTLAKVDLFSTLNKKELQVLARSSQERSYSAGTKLVSQGDSGSALYIIKSGKVKITMSTSSGEDRVVNTVGAGEVIGEMALLDDQPRSATITAIEDVTALVLPVWEFRGVLKEHPDIALKLLAVLSRRLRKAEE